ncbi:alpha/beta-hydrolase [Fomitiporia mediterranea MF3/22]|uniref:alpha/beta-hydrolase n=1 Tax=Fomitiporia mediterranea (strain MF3/22) TaxID=694068 RepID=UPI00044082BB|nr:alpha/beta-hydrolase [Fomitiporia mediterranea MF3/22]EJD07879.1 alpha/beta-hydrolase [Fomitiporia mediterranea MF3/22]
MAFDTPKRIEVKYDESEVQGVLALLKASPFPDKAPIDTDTPWKLGIDYDYLKMLKERFETEWSWKTLEKKIAKFENYTVHYEYKGDVLDLHYVHVKSQRSNAIPLILLHGWPGSFFDFHKVIEPLTNPPGPDLPAFDVVVPSLPGYFLSTLPRRDGWNLVDIARLFDGLMTSVLGYRKYTGQGGDWGSFIIRIMANMFPDSCSLVHFNMFYVESSSSSDISRLSESEKKYAERWNEKRATTFGYLSLQTTKPFTIGSAIASSPLAILAYIGEKIYGWSDPDLIDPQDLLDTVALYYLSGCFPTSVIMYNQSGTLLRKMFLPATEGHFLIKNKFGYSVFPYESARAAKVDVETFGPLAYIKEHESGGHFPALDSPEALVNDLREFFGEHWSRV